MIENKPDYKTIYWTRDAKAVQEFCQQKQEKWSNRSDTLFSALALSKVSERISSTSLQLFLHNKGESYSELHELRGRNAPGRSPFSYPNWQHRFHRIEQLEEFLDEKILYHTRLIACLQQACSSKTYEQMPEKFKNRLRSLLDYSTSALNKWTDRKKLSLFDKQKCLLAPLKDPLALMRITSLHERGILGEGGEVVVREDSLADPWHSALEENLLLQEAEKKKIEEQRISDHTTHVCGIIGGKANLTIPHSGVAPKSKVLSVDKRYRPPEGQNVSIFNYSYISYGGNLNEELSEITKKGGLLVQGIANDSLIIDLDPHHSPTFPQRNKEFKERTILVINVHADGLTPGTGTNFPGKTWATAAVSAVGTDVLSTDRGNAYTRKTGTSMATAFGSGVAALIQGEFPWFSADEIRKCILEGATPILLDENFEPKLIKNPEDLSLYSQKQIDLSRQFFGWGLLNAENAMEKAEALAVQHYFKAKFRLEKMTSYLHRRTQKSLKSMKTLEGFCLQFKTDLEAFRVKKEKVARLIEKHTEEIDFLFQAEQALAKAAELIFNHLTEKERKLEKTFTHHHSKLIQKINTTLCTISGFSNEWELVKSHMTLDQIQYIVNLFKKDADSTLITILNTAIEELSKLGTKKENLLTRKQKISSIVSKKKLF